MLDKMIKNVGAKKTNSSFNINIYNSTIFFLKLQIDGQLAISLKEIDLNLNHKINDKILHSWQMTAKVSEIEDSNKVRIVSMVKRIDSEKQQWKVK